MIALARLHAQQLVAPRARTAREVVAALCAVQAQEYPWSLWAVGARLPGATEGEVEGALARNEIVRTWPMRGTLHLVAPEDVRWMLALLTPRVIAGTAKRVAELGLGEAAFARSQALMVEALADGRRLSRKELYARLGAGGVATAGQLGYHLLLRAAMAGVICGVEGQRFALLDEVAPPQPPLGRDEALARLAERYVAGHGPATAHDLAWWAGLTVSDARRALALAGDAIGEVEIEGARFVVPRGWEAPSPAPAPIVHLIASFDEYLLGYARWDAMLGPSLVARDAIGRNGLFPPFLMVDGVARGTWRRQIRAERVALTVEPFAPLSDAERAGVEGAAEGYARYVGAAGIESLVVQGR